jgi:hypothetical protein
VLRIERDQARPGGSCLAISWQISLNAHLRDSGADARNVRASGAPSLRAASSITGQEGSASLLATLATNRLSC